LVVKVNGKEIDPAGERTVAVTVPSVKLEVAATGHGKEPVAVTVAAGGADERALTAAADGSFPAVTLPLKPGNNTVRVRAANANAPAETRDKEAEELDVTVRYDEPMKEPAPKVEPIMFTPTGERQRLDGKKDVIA